MIESSHIMDLLKGVYIIYLLIVVSLMWLFVFGLTSKRILKPKIRVPFYGWVALLVIAGVGIHILTFHKIPWVKWDLSRDNIKVDREFDIAIADYTFRFPEKTLLIKEGEMVRFNLESRDLTYGFGLFREDGSMLFQMQVVPDHKNDIVWKFDRPGTYSIRSTEYSGPKGENLYVKDSVIIADEQTFAMLASRSEQRLN